MKKPSSPETLDSPPPHIHHHVDPEQATDQSSAAAADDTSSSETAPLTRNSSLSRLNAEAPEFVPLSPSTLPPRADLNQPQPQQSVVVVPAPPTGGLVPVSTHSPQSQFHGTVPLQVQNHHRLYHHHQPGPHHRPHYYGVLTDDDSADPSQLPPADPDIVSSLNDDLSEEATQKILNQAEYYFSDLNLATTDHLMRFINKDPEGFVPVSVVSGFKKIRAITSSHSQLASVLRNSTKLVVSEDGKRVRRQHLLTETDMEELQSRIVVAENLPEDHCFQNLMKVFSAVGSVKTIRTCQPQGSNGGSSSTSRLTKPDYMFFSNKLHAFVEYETVEMAEKAVAELNGEGSWRSSLRVSSLLKRKTRSSQARKKVNEVDGNFEEDDASMSEQQRNVLDSQEQTGEEHFNERERVMVQRRGRGRGRGRGRVRGLVGTPPSNGLGSCDQPGAGKQHPPGPRMPDGTRGFAMGRGKPVTVHTA